MYDLVDSAGRRKLFLMCDGARKTGVEQRAHGRLSKVPGQIALFHAPENGCCIEFTDTGSDHRPAK